MGRMPDDHAGRRAYGRPMSHLTEIGRRPDTGATRSASETTLGRLGAWAADHRRLVVIVWGVAVLALGALAPFADRALSGAGWEAPGSESGAARRAIEADFPGQGSYALRVVVAGDRALVGEPSMRSTLTRVERLLRRDPDVRSVVPPQPHASVSPDRRTAIVTGLAGAPPADMVKAAGRLDARLARLSGPGVTVRLTGPAAMWSDFNR